MKSTVCLILALWLGFHCCALAEPPRSHQWVELPLSDSRAWCDLAQATEIWFVGQDRVVAFQVFGSNGPPTEAHFLFEDDAAAAQIVLKAVQTAPERWLPTNEVERPAGVAIYLNLDEVTAVYFRTDKIGEYAQVIMRGQTIMESNRAVKNPSAGHNVRIPADIERLKKLFTAH